MTAFSPPPQDVWQLAERLVQLVPLSQQKLEALLGTPMVPNQQNFRRREGGAVRLGPALLVTSSVIGVIDGTWSFAAIDVEPAPCITADDVKAHHPAVALRRSPRGHSSDETFDWAVPHEWGTLTFGIREKDMCLATVSLERAKSAVPN